MITSNWVNAREAADRALAKLVSEVDRFVRSSTRLPGDCVIDIQADNLSPFFQFF